MQYPTCVRTQVRTVHEARVIFHAVSLGLLRMVTRRLDTEERRAITSGSVYVWEERTSHSDPTSSAIERWTDSIRWGPSKVKDEFLFYQEREPSTDIEVRDPGSSSYTILRYPTSQRRERLIKQTFSVYVSRLSGEVRKWHLIAYFTESTLDSLHRICSHPLYPHLANIPGPAEIYQRARIVRARGQRRPTPPADPPTGTHTLTSSRRSSLTIDEDKRTLAPLTLSHCPGIQARHPLDEKAVMSFSMLSLCERPRSQAQLSAW
ncbi:Gti1/Pac2 family-domain-containing protein [Coprinopsis sp. MPI-PUGE-AT-0042]|nr:Gti1/Pac2 family-domain-containing protein [Coprinopsis sp. MPI-PUGE-AT-0042]